METWLMSSEIFTWTCDVEFDYGGRTNSSYGIEYGLPKILEIFRAYSVKGLFFISSEILKTHTSAVQDIITKGHKIGSHGHFHINYKNSRRANHDMEISKTLLGNLQNGPLYYRAPKFNHRIGGDIYSDPSNHVSLLKRVWFNQSIPNNPIFYLHPFDIIKPQTKSPNIFCKILYSRHKEVYDTLKRLVQCYPGRISL